MRSLLLGLLTSMVAVACTGIEDAITPRPSGPSSANSATGPTASPVPALLPVTASTPVPVPVALPLARTDVERAFPNLSYPGMVGLTYPDDDTDRLFLVLQPGQVVVFPNREDVDAADVFLDIRDRVSDRGKEEGLLGLAFDPAFRSNGHFYVYYSASGPRRSVLSRFSVSDSDPNTADPASEMIVLEVPQPYSNHNGGQVVFGPDGYLYVGLGDGGNRGDPHGNGQNPSTLLGAILRLDVAGLDSTDGYTVPSDNPFVGRTGEVRKEIWAYGLRNPWRFTFDSLNGDLWAADVGQNRLEEVDIVRPGLNYGWNTMEGSRCFQPSRGCDQEGLEGPIAEYGREDGCSVTGGYVYRGNRLPALYGAYVYGDFCSGKIWGLRYDGSRATERMELVDSDLQISSFGEDRSGEVFILSFDEKIYRLMPR